MEIRYLTTDDAGEWLRLRLDALQGDPEAFSASLEEYQSLSLEEVRKRLGFEAKGGTPREFAELLDKGCRVITLFPAEELPISHRY